MGYMAKKVLLLSELPMKSYDKGKSATRAFTLLALLTLAWVLIVFFVETGMITIDPPNPRGGKPGIDLGLLLIMGVSLALCSGVYQAQKKLRWLDYRSAFALYAQVSKNPLLCLVVNDAVPPSTGVSATAYPDADVDSLTPDEETMRKSTLTALRLCIWNAHHITQMGIVSFLGGVIIMTAEVRYWGCVVHDAFPSLMDVGGLLAIAGGLLVCFITLIWSHSLTPAEQKVKRSPITQRGIALIFSGVLLLAAAFAASFVFHQDNAVIPMILVGLIIMFCGICTVLFAWGALLLFFGTLALTICATLAGFALIRGSMSGFIAMFALGVCVMVAVLVVRKKRRS